MAETREKAAQQKVEGTRARLTEKLKAMQEAAEQALKEARSDHDEISNKASSQQEALEQAKGSVENARERLEEVTSVSDA